MDLLGDRGIIDLGIKRDATVAEALSVTRRRRRHRIQLLNDIEDDLVKTREKMDSLVDDICLWKRESGFKKYFSTSETWRLLRDRKLKLAWTRVVWFSNATPKHAFIAWLANLNRLSTLDRVSKWSQGVDVTCVLCKNEKESRNHLFFECSYTSQVWEFLTKGILTTSYSKTWDVIIQILSDGKMEKKRLFCLRYAFQITIYTFWRERNRLRHGEKLVPMEALKKLIDKGIRNKLSLLRRKGIRNMREALTFWFQTRTG